MVYEGIPYRTSLDVCGMPEVERKGTQQVLRDYMIYSISTPLTCHQMVMDSRSGTVRSHSGQF
jgi:hypothetical protein